MWCFDPEFKGYAIKMMNSLALTTSLKTFLNVPQQYRALWVTDDSTLGIKEEEIGRLL